MIGNFLNKCFIKATSHFNGNRINSSSFSSFGVRNVLNSFLGSFNFPRIPGQVRFVTYGQEFQPSRRRQKRKHGYLLRKSTPSGRRIIARRIAKGRTSLSH